MGSWRSWRLRHDDCYGSHKGVKSKLMNRIALLVVIAAIPCVAFPCTFQFDPAAVAKYYRSDGWQLPGINLKSSAPDRYAGPYPGADIPGARAVALPHEAYPYIIEFPAQTFNFDGTLKRMRHVQARAAILRWEMNGHIFAYSYGLIPVSAHRIDGKWKIDVELGCIFNATFIDENGDGVFRLLVPQALTESLIPAWVKRPESD